MEGDKRIIGIRLNEDNPSVFDIKLRRLARLYILEAVAKVKVDGVVTRKVLALELGMDRNRVARLVKALGLAGVWG